MNKTDIIKTNGLIYLLLIMAGLVTVSCQNVDAQKTMYVSGSIEGLPDGWIHMLDQQSNVIDSAITTNGSFDLSVANSKYPEPIYVSLDHFDSTGTKRMFNFKMSKLYNGRPWMTQYLLLEDGAHISGTLIDFTPKDFTLSQNIKLVYPTNKVKGTQNKVMNTLAFDFAGKWDEERVDSLKNIIKNNSHSYYVLYELKGNYGSLDDQQLEVLLNGFDKNLKKSSTFRDIERRIAIRVQKALSGSTVLLSLDGEKTHVIDTAKQLNMVILWASWCGPCRAEIPDLKDLYQQYAGNKDFRMVSVSLDREKANWTKAASQEDMPWEQLWITQEWMPYQQELFSFDGSMPTVLFTDSKGKIIQKFVGYDKESLVKYKQAITQHLKNL